MAALVSIFVALAVFAAIALVLVVIVGEPSPMESRLAALSQTYTDDVEEAEDYDKFRLQDIFTTITRPLAPFRDWLRSKDAELSYRLSLAGFRKPEDADTFLSAKLLGPVVGILLATFAGVQDFFFAALLLGVVGFFAPDIFLFRAIGRRKDKINKALPDVLDLMVICMEAGLGIDQATLRIAQEIENVYPELSEELFITGYEQRAGKPRLDAWRSMSDRVDLDTVRQFVAMLVQTERLGTPIAHALGQFADSLRTKRLMLAEEAAAKTTVKLIFPLAIFIFPALFVVLLGPGIITVLKALENSGR
ncbi:MAG TPA: type II secretion system F family protein [Terriglobales bacterium]|nr:type II secretion system F family protein [Terriglobales bacterium]